MTLHHKMDAPFETSGDHLISGRVIGQPLDRPDGPLKVSGQATYAHEWPIDNRAYGVLVRATIAKGKVATLHKGDIEELDGILGVFDDHRMLRNPAQGKADEAPAQGPGEVVYFGQPIALVVAETFEQARHGVQALKVDYQIADDAELDPEAATTPKDKPEDDTDQGDLEAAMGAAAFTLDEVYRTPAHNSAAMEPHAAIASWEGDQLTLHGSFQMIKYNVNELADALDVDPENVRILSPYVGGGFGSKLGLSSEAVAAAIAAKALDRPVAVALSRPQVFEAVMRRSETRQRIRLAADEKGVLQGIGHEALVSNLPGEDFFEPVVQATHFLYGGKSRKLAVEVARINRTCAGSVRAPGEAVGVLALETAMDELAHSLGIDPVELRKRNIPEKDPEQDIPFSSRRFADALSKGAESFGWDQRCAEPASRREGEWLIGMGMASAARINSLMESKARITLNPDGTALVETDMTDIGTGSYAIFTQIAAELLGLEPDAVETKLGDSALPKAAGSGGSWGASSAGSSIYLACLDIRRQIAAKLGCDWDELVLDNKVARAATKEMSFKDVTAGERLIGEGHIEPGETSDAVRQATFGAHFAEVAVSAATGETRVRRMLGVFSAGRILNRKTAISQCYGGMTWGIGGALTEHLVFDARDGHVVNRDLAEYHVPVNLDVPQLEVILLDEEDPWACPLQSKGLGELGICGAGAAIGNAIFNASGVRVRDFPITLDKILEKLPEPLSMYEA